MRTKNLLLSAAAVVAGVLSAQAQNNVYSVNVVGYVNQSFAGNRFYTLTANPLASGNDTIGSVFTNLPAGSTVLKWNPVTATYITANHPTATTWTPAGVQNNTVNPGEGVFVRTPTGSPGYTNTFVGQVLTGTVTNTITVGYNLVGNQIPLAGDVTALGLTAIVPANPPATANQLLKWNSGSQTYSTFNRIGTGWTPSLPSLSVGEGFFLRNRGAASFDWSQTYTNQ